MKRFLLSMAVAVAAVFATAQTKVYSDLLNVSINGGLIQEERTDIDVTANDNGTYTLTLRNFILQDEDPMPVGNIVLDIVAADLENGVKELSFNGEIEIANGDDDNYVWAGPELGAIPVTLSGKMTADKLYCDIAIDLTFMQVGVVFGKDIKKNTTYNDALKVNINGQLVQNEQTTINVVEFVDGTYSLALRNFILQDEEPMPVGNIILDNIAATETDGVYSFSTERNIQIAAGDDKNAFWMGPELGAVPVVLVGKMTAEKLYCDITIDLGFMQVGVVFGNEDITGIEAVEAGQGVKVIHDLTGRRIEAINAPGIYIVGGKKVVVK